jgi:hypothetical protein
MGSVSFAVAAKVASAVQTAAAVRIKNSSLSAFFDFRRLVGVLRESVLTILS